MASEGMKILNLSLFDPKIILKWIQFFLQNPTVNKM